MVERRATLPWVDRYIDEYKICGFLFFSALLCFIQVRDSSIHQIGEAIEARKHVNEIFQGLFKTWWLLFVPITVVLRKNEDHQTAIWIGFFN